MAAFGAELISVPSSSDGGGMEAARDMASRMQVRPTSASLLIPPDPDALANYYMYQI